MRTPHFSRHAAAPALLASALLACALPAAAATDCAGLRNAAVPKTAIALPTSGAVVKSATLVAASGSTPEYCQVMADVLPVDAAAPPIHFQINLPTLWLQPQRAMQFGGGGYDGKLVDGLGNVPHAWPNSLTPLQRSYVTFGSDSGHTGQNWDASFALNEEALRNFTGEALKKVRDAAQALMLKRYGSAPGKTYFAGGSSGGREAMAVAQRWPADYDGIIAYYPVLEFTGTVLHGNQMAKALYSAGGYVNSDKLNFLNDRVVEACDGLDGVNDGLINNVAACHFDPAVLRCYANVDWGPGCLTDAQIASVRSINNETTLSYPLANGVMNAPGYNVLAGANFSGLINVGALDHLLEPPDVALNGYGATMQANWVKYFVTRQANFNTLQFDAANPGTWRARVQQVSGWHDATSVELTAFTQRGGKILMLHGTSDTVVSPRVSQRYYARLVQRFGVDNVRSFLRFYTVAGMAHGYGRYLVGWNSLDPLEAWVEQGTPPPAQVSKDVANIFGRTRPLCEYPAFPRYTGGWVEQASSFSCALQ